VTTTPEPAATPPPGTPEADTEPAAPEAAAEAGPEAAGGRRRRELAAAEVLRYGVPVEMSCYLRASFGPFPRRGRQGLLVLEGGTATWRSGWVRKTVHRLPLAGAGVTERALKKGRRDPAPLFRVVEVTRPEGRLELTIPTSDIPTFRIFLASLAG
jgi:hypothetical protein